MRDGDPTGLRESVNALGLADAEAAISVHALIGSDPDLLADAGELPRSVEAVPAWVKSTFLNGEHPFFARAEHAAATVLGEAPDERAEKALATLVPRPRTVAELAVFTGADGLEDLLEYLRKAGLVRVEPNGLDPDEPFWAIDDRFARFYYAMMAGDDLERWRRGRITDKLWRMTHARFDRYVARAEFTRVAREWAAAEPEAVRATRVVVPDPRFRQLRTLEIAAFGPGGDLLALGTVRWRFRMRLQQLQRLRHVRRLLGEPPVRLYCVASRFDDAIAADDAADLRRVGPDQLLKRD